MRIGHRVPAVTLAAVMTLVLAAGCSSGKKDASADVHVTACTADPGGGKPTADGTIQNASSKDSAYAFTVTFSDSSGNKVSTGAVSVGKVTSGGQATWHTLGATNAKGPVTCTVGNVARTAVP